jgi:hypothetical protein
MRDINAGLSPTRHLMAFCPWLRLREGLPAEEEVLTLFCSGSLSHLICRVAIHRTTHIPAVGD